MPSHPERGARTTQPRRARWGAGLVIACLALTGCSGGNGDTSSSASSTPSSTPSSAGSEATPSAPPSVSPTISEEATPFKTLAGFVDNDKVALEVYPLKRNGKLASLQLRMTVAGGADDPAQVASTFGDGSVTVGAADLDSMDGVQLVDSVHGKLYLAATDADQGCLCSDNLGTAIIHAGQSVTLDVTFAAPPASDSSIDVRIPKFGTTSDVPIQ